MCVCVCVCNSYNLFCMMTFTSMALVETAIATNTNSRAYMPMPHLQLCTVCLTLNGSRNSHKSYQLTVTDQPLTVNSYQLTAHVQVT